MTNLNLPTYSFKVKSKENKLYIFDNIRKKNVVLTPEEWVRQNYIAFLIFEKKYPPSLISVEKKLILNTLTKRTDIVIFDASGKPNIIVECKAPSVKITQSAFDQIAQYNMTLNAKYLIVTNGLQHFYCQMNFEKMKYDFLKEIPSYIRRSF